MKIEKKEYRGLPYEEVDNLYVRMDKIDFDMMVLYFDSVQNNIEATSKLCEALREQVEALTEQNTVLKTMLMMKEPKEEDVYCLTGDISCPYNAEGLCTLENPEEECDDYYGAVGDEEEDENLYDPCIGLAALMKDMAINILPIHRAEEKYFLEDEE